MKNTTNKSFNHSIKIEFTEDNYRSLKKCSKVIGKDISFIINSILAKIDLIAVKKF